MLRYINEHHNKYDTILWLDASNKSSLLSSFTRCCNDLSLPTYSARPSESTQLLRDSSTVRALLRWLQVRTEHQPWLVVLDSVDDLRAETWNVKDIIPQGCGSVIMTSRDRRASTELEVGSKAMKVDCMLEHEAKTLLWRRIGGKTGSQPAGMSELDDLAQLLDWFPLALELAGANINEDIKSMGTDSDSEDEQVEQGFPELAGRALRQYIENFERHQDSMLKSEDHASTREYKPSMWTVWETTFLALQELEAKNQDMFPLQLLSFLARSPSTVMEEELFRLASRKCDWNQHHKQSLPLWLQGMINTTSKDRWDDWSYRKSIDMLFRFGLLQKIPGFFPGVTMHSLIRWRACIVSDVSFQCWYFRLVAASVISMVEDPRCMEFDHRLSSHVMTCHRVVSSDPTPSDIRSRLIILCIWVCIRHGRFAQASNIYDDERWDEESSGGRLAKELDILAYDQLRSGLACKIEASRQLEKLGSDMLKKSTAPSHTLTHLYLLNTFLLFGRGYQISSRHYVIVLLRILESKIPKTDSRILAARSQLFYELSTFESLHAQENEHLNLYRSVLGNGHEHTSRQVLGFAYGYIRFEQFEEAESLLEDACKTLRETHGLRHPAYQGAAEKLSCVYILNDRLSDAFYIMPNARFKCNVMTPIAPNLSVRDQMEMKFKFIDAFLKISEGNIGIMIATLLGDDLHQNARFMLGRRHELTVRSLLLKTKIEWLYLKGWWSTVEESTMGPHCYPPLWPVLTKSGGNSDQPTETSVKWLAKYDVQRKLKRARSVDVLTEHPISPREQLGPPRSPPRQAALPTDDIGAPPRWVHFDDDRNRYPALMYSDGREGKSRFASGARVLEMKFRNL